MLRLDIKHKQENKVNPTNDFNAFILQEKDGKMNFQSETFGKHMISQAQLMHRTALMQKKAIEMDLAYLKDT